MTTESDGEAYVSVQLRGTDIEIQTWNNSLSDTEDHTMIRRSDALYTSLRDIKEGDDVTVAGAFLEGDKDYIKETSLTEGGSMTEPEFIVRVSRIGKGVQSLEKPDAAQPVTRSEKLPLTPAVSQEPSPSAVVEHVTPPASDMQQAQPLAATCEVVNAQAFSCVIESRSTTDASAGEDWRITILNSSYVPAVFIATSGLQDDAGVIVKASSWEDLSVGGYGRYIFTGRLEHDNNLKFARLVAKL